MNNPIKTKSFNKQSVQINKQHDGTISIRIPVNDENLEWVEILTGHDACQQIIQALKNTLETLD